MLTQTRTGIYSFTFHRRGHEGSIYYVFLKSKSRIFCIYFYFLFFLFFFFRPVKIISLILSRANHKVGRKREIPQQNHLTTRMQNLATRARLEPQRCDDERFRALKISSLNHSATGTTYIHYFFITIFDTSASHFF